MEYKYLFTIFTPTYNRAYALNRVYQSLKNQTNKNFEWIIVDDGSVDNTKTLIENWIQEPDFPIRYIYQENKGKYIAFNRALSIAQGELFLTFDSDDECKSNALERFGFAWNNIAPDIRNNFSGVTCLCEDQLGNLVGNRFPKDNFDSNSIEVRYRYKVKGEKWGFQRTNILKENIFPVIEGEKYIPEGVVWDTLARNYKVRFINEVLRIYWIDKSQSSDQITHITDPGRHAAGQVLHKKSQLNNDMGWFKYAPIELTRTAVHYSRFSFHANIQIRSQLNSLTNLKAKILFLCTVLIGYLVYKKDKILYKQKDQKT